VQSPSPQSANAAAPAQFMSPQQPISVRHLPHFSLHRRGHWFQLNIYPKRRRPRGLGWFQDHLDALLESVRSFRFDQFEMHLRTFLV